MKREKRDREKDRQRQRERESRSISASTDGVHRAGAAQVHERRRQMPESSCKT